MYALNLDDDLCNLENYNEAKELMRSVCLCLGRRYKGEQFCSDFNSELRVDVCLYECLPLIWYLLNDESFLSFLPELLVLCRSVKEYDLHVLLFFHRMLSRDELMEKLCCCCLILSESNNLTTELEMVKDRVQEFMHQLGDIESELIH